MIMTQSSYKLKLPILLVSFRNEEEEEVNHENFPVRRRFFQLPEDEREKNTLRNYEFVLANFLKHFADTEMSSINPEGILDFMSEISDGTKPKTKKLRFTLFSALFNFVKNNEDRKLFLGGSRKTGESFGFT